MDNSWKLDNCNVCGGKISYDTVKCPHCGQANPGSGGIVQTKVNRGCLKIIAIPLLILWLIAAFLFWGLVYFIPSLQ